MIVHMRFEGGKMKREFEGGKMRRVAGELYWRSRLKGKDKLKVQTVSIERNASMKKATKAASARTPARKMAATKTPSAKLKSRSSQAQAQLLLILERLAQSAERLAQAAERLAEAAVRTPGAQESGQNPAGQDEMLERPGEVVGVMVVDESDDENGEE
jgi:hypothetical protein